MSETPSNLSRAAMLGLSAGLAIAAIVLLVWARLRLNVDCSTLTGDECGAEEEVASQIAGYQAVAALGLACISAGLFVFNRRR